VSDHARGAVPFAFSWLLYIQSFPQKARSCNHPKQIDIGFGNLYNPMPPQKSGMQLGLGSFTLKQRQLFQGVKHGVIVSSHDPRPLPLGSTACDCGESEAGEAHREVHRSRLGQCLVRGSYITYCILSYIIPLICWIYRKSIYWFALQLEVIFTNSTEPYIYWAWPGGPFSFLKKMQHEISRQSSTAVNP